MGMNGRGRKRCSNSCGCVHGLSTPQSRVILRKILVQFSELVVVIFECQILVVSRQCEPWYCPRFKKIRPISATACALFSSLALWTKPTTLAHCSGSAGPHVVPRSHHDLGCSVASLHAASSTSAGLSLSCPSSLVLSAVLPPPPLPLPPPLPPGPPPRCRLQSLRRRCSPPRDASLSATYSPWSSPAVGV